MQVLVIRLRNGDLEPPAHLLDNRPHDGPLLLERVDVSEEEILKLNIPTGIPLVYELDQDLKPLRHYYLGDQAEIEKAMQAVANQGKAAK